MLQEDFGDVYIVVYNQIDREVKEQTIPVTIYHIEKQVEFLHNEIKELKNKLENEILSNEERSEIKIMLNILNQKIKVFKTI
jgi:hypothetical protein